VSAEISENMTEPDKQVNWLPASLGGFELFIRAYGPKSEVLNKSWGPPPVVRIK